MSPLPSSFFVLECPKCGEQYAPSRLGEEHQNCPQTILASDVASCEPPYKGE